jgi:hypothetical protein
LQDTKQLALPCYTPAQLAAAQPGFAAVNCLRLVFSLLDIERRPIHAGFKYANPRADQRSWPFHGVNAN